MKLNLNYPEEMSKEDKKFLNEALLRGFSPQQKELHESEVINISPGAYKKHKRIQAFLGGVVGTTCRKYHAKEFNYSQLSDFQDEGARKAVRTYGLNAVIRAWKELERRMIELPGRKMEDIPVLFQPMADTFWKRFGLPRNMVDTIWDRETEEAIEARKHVDWTKPQFNTCGELIPIPEDVKEELAKREVEDERKINEESQIE
jgi:hypothetical protein